MTEKLNPSEAQRKAMIQYADEYNPEQEYGSEHFVDGLIAAANNIPEGAPIDTIARRPDGAVIAFRGQKFGHPFWTYRWLDDGPDVPTVKHTNDADSWPVIYNPTEPDPLETFKQPTYFDDSDELPDPTAQQEPERFPGIENPTTADYVGADNADEQLELIFGLRDIRIERGLSVAFVGEALCLEDAEVERFESGSMNPTMSLIRRYARAVEAVFTVDVRKWEDTSAQQEPGGYGMLSANQVDAILEHHGVKREPSPRTPRVVDRLGVDEQGSRWMNCCGQVHEFRDGCWKYEDGGKWYLSTLSFPKFTEILEPRVLPTLDCEEARDGAVWADSDTNIPFRYRFHDSRWERFSERGNCAWVPLSNLNYLKLCGPYTEVLGDPS